MVSRAGALGVRCMENLEDWRAEMRVGSGPWAWEVRASGLPFWIARIETWALASVRSRLEDAGACIRFSAMAIELARRRA